MTGEAQRGKQVAAHLCGERIPMRLAPTGLRRLPDLRARDHWDRIRQTSLLAGRPPWRAPIAARAQHSRSGAAGREGTRPPARRRTAGG
jgi:hypothetical protein